ncbi:MAG TPA: hypothetical protein VGJ97_13295 [Anaerolineaceae bacterium]
MNVFDDQGCPVLLGEGIGRGGEATVYRVNSDPGQITKIYERAPRPDYPAKLAWMVAHPPINPTQALMHPSLAWPDGLLYDAHTHLVGYQMPYIRAAVPILDVFNPRRRAAILPRFDRRYLHRAARNLCAAVGTLHTHGYVAGDLNESNILVTPSALVTLIDTDSFQVEEARDGQAVMHFCPVGKPEYLPPELLGKPLAQTLRAPAQDNFALAVLIFQLLMEGNHPFRAQWLGAGEPPPIEVRIAQGAFPYTSLPHGPVKPPSRVPDLNRLHPALVDLIRRCFLDGHVDPALRPAPAAWEAAVVQAERALVTCSRGHIYSNHLSVCPDCPPPPRRFPSARPSRPVEPSPAQPRPAPDPRPEPSPAVPRPAAPQAVRTSGGAPAPTQPKPAVQPKHTPQPAASVRASSPNRPTTAPPKAWVRSWPGMPPRPLLTWVGLRVAKSLAIGGTLGALAGAVPGAFLAAASHSLGAAAAWTLLFALGGASGGLLRGWKPGYRLGAWVDRYMGWTWVWQALGMLLGAGLGLMVGMVFWWAIFPVFLGAFLGARAGISGGRLLWLAAKRFGWGRIWAVVFGCGAAATGYLLANWTANQGLGQLVTTWTLINASDGLVWTWVITGAACGGLGGAMAGMIADLVARLTGLVD